jgi:hypothetical protein
VVFTVHLRTSVFIGFIQQGPEASDAPPDQGLARPFRPSGRLRDSRVRHILEVPEPHRGALSHRPSSQRREDVQPSCAIHAAFGVGRRPEMPTRTPHRHLECGRFRHELFARLIAPQVAHNVEGDAVELGAQGHPPDAILWVAP